MALNAWYHTGDSTAATVHLCATTPCADRKSGVADAQWPAIPHTLTQHHRHPTRGNTTDKSRCAFTPVKPVSSPSSCASRSTAAASSSDSTALCCFNSILRSNGSDTQNVQECDVKAKQLKHTGCPSGLPVKAPQNTVVNITTANKQDEQLTEGRETSGARAFPQHTH
jgi:hypothetical protein